MGLFGKIINKKTIVLVVLLALSLPLFSLSRWDMTKSYLAGDEVIFNNVVWRAKWWSLNEVPGRFVDSAWERVEDLYDYSDNLAPSQLPPGGLKPEEVPMFILIGSDDNFVPEGMHWLLDYVRERRHSDGSKVKLSFYHPISSLWSQEITDSWIKAMDDGHEVANHSYDHLEGGSLLTLEQWIEQIVKTNQRLIADRPFGLGVYESEIKGFRAPSLGYNNSSFKVVKDNHMHYDSSIEEGWQLDQDGTNYYWPYTLNNGSPANKLLAGLGFAPLVDPVEGLWELPIYTLMTPTDAECVELGIKPGLRERCAVKTKWYSSMGYKISGLDWSILHQYHLTEEEHLAILKYNLDKRLSGNRAPFTYVIHSNYYADPANRRVLGQFIDYALSKKEVRFVTAKEFLKWMRNPTPLEAK